MHKHIAFRMKLWRLLDSFHCLDLWQNLAQQSSFVEEKKSLARMALREHPGKLVPDPLPRNLIDLRCQPLNCVKCAGLDGVAEPRREAHRAQHAELILGEAPLRVANSSNDSSLEIIAAAHKIQNLV